MIQISNVARGNSELLPDLVTVFEDVVRSGQYIKGHYLEQFEMEFAAYNDAMHCLGVNSGTDALFLAMKACGIGPGDEVITTAMSFLATAEAIALTGAKPVFVDIFPDGQDLIDEQQIQAVITQKTKAIVPVHMHGYMCNMEEIMKIAKTHNLLVIEDCAQATGAICEIDVDGVKVQKRAGTIGHAGCFSFFPTKNLGCIGDGGAIITNDIELAKKIKILREHGSAIKNFPEAVGHNSRLDAIQAAFLSVKLPYLDQWNNIRAKIAIAYTAQILDKCEFWLDSLQLAPIRPNAVFHHFPIRTRPGIRECILSDLRNNGIEAISYYPYPIPLMAPYKDGRDWSASQAATQAISGFSLPMFPELTELEIKHVVKWLAESLRRNA